MEDDRTSGCVAVLIFSSRATRVAPCVAPRRATPSSLSVPVWSFGSAEPGPVEPSIRPGLPGARAPFEFNVFKVTAKVTQAIAEDDRDLHLVLSDGTHTMIAEAPDAACNTGARAYRRKQMLVAHDAVKICNALVTGVAFFDFFHHQTGVAPNEIELHPILAFRCLPP